MPNRSQKSTKTFQTISGQIKTPDFGKSSCLIEISTEGETLVVGNAEARFYLPIEEMQKAMERLREEGQRRGIELRSGATAKHGMAMRGEGTEKNGKPMEQN